MKAVPCSRCTTGWDKKLKACTIETGCEHLPLEAKVPECPIQDRCQHQIQRTTPCEVRARGLICESALDAAGIESPWDHPLSFNADFVASPEELERHLREMER